MCHEFIGLNLEKGKKNNLNFDWKYVLALVGNSCSLQVGHGALVGNGSGPTLFLVQNCRSKFLLSFLP